MENPCNECIVQAMCKIPCDDFVDYIADNTSATRIGIPEVSIPAIYVARQIRVGEYKIGKNNIRRIFDEVPMCRVYR